MIRFTERCLGSGRPEGRLQGRSPAPRLSFPVIGLLLACLTAIGTAQAQAPPLTQTRIKAVMTDGKSIEGVEVGRTDRALQLRTDDERIHLLRRAADDKFREATSQSDWPDFNGQFNGNRYTTVTQIDKTSVTRLA